MTKFNLIKDILMIALISFLIYDRINPKPVASEKIVTVIRDTVTTPVIVTKPVPVKPIKKEVNIPVQKIHYDTLQGPFPPIVIDVLTNGASEQESRLLYQDTIDIHPRVRIYAEHDAIDLVESRYKADIKLDTTVIIKENPCPRLPYFSFYAFSQMSNTGASVGAAVAGRKVIAGYSYDLIQKSHQVTIGYRIASL